jgi:hypothetical protein
MIDCNSSSQLGQICDPPLMEMGLLSLASGFFHRVAMVAQAKLSERLSCQVAAPTPSIGSRCPPALGVVRNQPPIGRLSIEYLLGIG